MRALRARSGRLRAVGAGGGSGDGVRGDGFVSAPGEPPATCERCFGTGFEVVGGRGARRCDCRREWDRARLFEAAQIPARYGGCALENFEPVRGNVTHVRALAYARELLVRYPAVESGLLFVGPCGVGKTHLAVAVLRGLLAKGFGGLFCEVGALLSAVRDSYGSGSARPEKRVLGPLCRVPVLLLDELGCARPTEWVRETLLHIVGARYAQRRITILTTNYLDGRAGSADETLEERVGVRLRSRLHEMCRVVEMDGEDYRRRFDVSED